MSPFLILKLAEWPVERPRSWAALLDDPLDQGQVAVVRESVTRGRPLGDGDWVVRTAKRLGLEFTLRDAGRPRMARKARMDGENQ
jgi:putative transposase